MLVKRANKMHAYAQHKERCSAAGSRGANEEAIVQADRERARMESQTTYIRSLAEARRGKILLAEGRKRHRNTVNDNGGWKKPILVRPHLRAATRAPEGMAMGQQWQGSCQSNSQLWHEQRHERPISILTDQFLSASLL